MTAIKAAVMAAVCFNLLTDDSLQMNPNDVWLNPMKYNTETIRRSYNEIQNTDEIQNNQ